MVPENIHTHPKEEYWKFHTEGGLIAKKKIIIKYEKGKNEPKLEFPDITGGGINTKCPPLRYQYGYSLEHISSGRYIFFTVKI